jgi:hypothetical protein
MTAVDRKNEKADLRIIEDFMRGVNSSPYFLIGIESEEQVNYW